MDRASSWIVPLSPVRTLSYRPKLIVRLAYLRYRRFFCPALLCSSAPSIVRFFFFLFVRMADQLRCSTLLVLKLRVNKSMASLVLTADTAKVKLKNSPLLRIRNLRCTLWRRRACPAPTLLQSRMTPRVICPSIRYCEYCDDTQYNRAKWSCISDFGCALFFTPNATQRSLQMRLGSLVVRALYLSLL